MLNGSLPLTEALADKPPVAHDPRPPPMWHPPVYVLESRHAW
jgi:hypothetical protein